MQFINKKKFRFKKILYEKSKKREKKNEIIIKIKFDEKSTDEIIQKKKNLSHYVRKQNCKKLSSVSRKKENLV